MADNPESHHPRWNLDAIALGWLLPGLGHYVLGMRKRGIILCVTIMGLWLAGLLIGGISVIDHRDRSDVNNHSWWFHGQKLVFPSILVNAVRDRLLANHVQKVANGGSYTHWNQMLEPDNNPPYEPSLARVAEQGVLYTALAGLLNVLAILDVAYCDPKRRRDHATTADEQPNPTAPAVEASA